MCHVARNCQAVVRHPFASLFSLNNTANSPQTIFIIQHKHTARANAHPHTPNSTTPKQWQRRNRQAGCCGGGLAFATCPVSLCSGCAVRRHAAAAAHSHQTTQPIQCIAPTQATVLQLVSHCMLLHARPVFSQSPGLLLNTLSGVRC